MSEPTDRAPTPTERLLAALDPQTDHDVGLAVVIAQDLPGDTAATLAELIERRIGRVLANLVLAEHMAETATTPGVPDPAQLAELTQAHRRLAGRCNRRATTAACSLPSLPGWAPTARLGWPAWSAARSPAPTNVATRRADPPEPSERPGTAPWSADGRTEPPRCLPLARGGSSRLRAAQRRLGRRPFSRPRCRPH
jgi:hypothetical protein